MFQLTGTSASVVDLALIAGLTAVFISVLKPIVARFTGRASTLFDSEIQILAGLVAAGLISLATYEPAVFAVVSESVSVAAGAVGGYRIVAGPSSPAVAPVAPVATPDPAPVVAPVVPAEAPTA